MFGLKQRAGWWSSGKAEKLAPLVAVLAGGIVGSGARATIGVMFPIGGGRFPVSTLLVNLVGSLFLGLYLARRQTAVVARWSLQFWAIGALGSFTTFSTFSFEVFHLIDLGRASTAAWYVIVSIIGGLIAAILGDRLGSLVR